MFANASIVKLFPVPLWVHALRPEDAAAVNESLMPAIERERAAKPAPGPGETWQTGTMLQEDPAFQPLTGLIREAAEAVLQHLKAEYDSFRITALWADVTPPGGAPQRMQTHPDNYLSGIYCAQVPLGGSGLVFQDPRPQTDGVEPTFSEPNAQNSRNAHIEAQPGALIIFPSRLPHSFDRNGGESERISLGFTIMFAGRAGG
ncbi:MAG: TIGR02466 family protein [Kiloniellales bacterium]|nr:TIGR02466 family protein [Kiloniellales bacterium]